MHRIIVSLLMWMTAATVVADETTDLISDLRSDAHVRRFHATRQLHWMPNRPAEAIPVLISNLTDFRAPFADEPHPVQYLGPNISDASIAALAAIGRPAVPFLVDELEEAGVRMRMSLLRTLSRIGPQAHTAIPAIRRELKRADEEESFIRLEAIHALAQIGRDSAQTRRLLLQRLVDGRDVEYLLPYLPLIDPAGTTAIPLLRIHLRSDEGETVYAAIRALRPYGERASPAIPELAALLSSELQRMGFYRDIGGHSPVRVDAASALGQIGPPAVTVLEQLTDAEATASSHRNHLRVAISRISPDSGNGKAALQRVLSDFRDNDTEAARAIAESNSPRTIKVLMAVVGRKPTAASSDFQIVVLQSLAARWEQAADSVPTLNRVLMQWLANASPAERLNFVSQVVSLLGDLGIAAESSVPLLQRIRSECDDVLIRDQAGMSLWKIREAIQKTQADRR